MRSCTQKPADCVKGSQGHWESKVSLRSRYNLRSGCRYCFRVSRNLITRFSHADCHWFLGIADETVGLLRPGLTQDDFDMHDVMLPAMPEGASASEQGQELVDEDMPVAPDFLTAM